MKEGTPKKIIKKLWQNQIFRHVFYWFCTYAFVFLNILVWDTALTALKVSTILVLPGPIPVYLHFYVQRKFFEQRKYLPYIISLPVIILISGFLIEMVFHIIEKTPGSQTSGIGTAIGYLIVTSGFKYYRLGVKQQYRLQEAEFKQMQTELALLKSQINPHFFFNTLNNLYSLSLDKSERVPEVILKISDLMRYVLDNSKEKTVPLSDEVQFLKSYVALKKLRLSDNADVRMNVDGNFNGRQIAPMLLVPFIENSFKHGLNASAEAGYISIDITSEDNNLKFIIENSRMLSASPVENGQTKMGLDNVKRRLKLLYPDKHRLSIFEDESSYKVELEIQL